MKKIFEIFYNIFIVKKKSGFINRTLWPLANNSTPRVE